MDQTLEYVQGEEVQDGVINDNSSWGVGANPDRADRAVYMLLSQNDKSGNRTYINLINTSPLSALTWAIESAQDGWHQATGLQFVLWDGATEFTADVNACYHSSSGKFYKCTTTHTNVEPTSGSGPNNWEAITDFTEIQQGYTNVTVTDYDFPVESRTAVLIADKLYSTLGDKFLCKFQPEEAVNLLNVIATREGYRSKFIDDEPDQGEEIIRALEACLE